MTEEFKAGAEWMRAQAILAAHNQHNHPENFGCTCGVIQMAIKQIRVEDFQKQKTEGSSEQG